MAKGIPKSKTGTGGAGMKGGTKPNGKGGGGNRTGTGAGIKSKNGSPSGGK